MNLYSTTKKKSPFRNPQQLFHKKFKEQDYKTTNKFKKPKIKALVNIPLTIINKLKFKTYAIQT